MAAAEHKSFRTSDETRNFPKGRVDLINIGGGVVGQLTLEPGWRWSEHVTPVAGTAWCEAPHFQYQVSGGSASTWPMAPSSRAVLGMSRPCPRAMMPG